MDNEGDDAPDGEFLRLADLNGDKFGILGFKKDVSSPFAEALHSKLSIQHGNDDLAVPGRDGGVHDKDVAALDTGVPHRVAPDADEKCGRRVADEVLVEVERVLHVILGGRRKPGLDLCGGQRDTQLGAGFKRNGLADGHEKSVRPGAGWTMEEAI